MSHAHAWFLVAVFVCGASLRHADAARHVLGSPTAITPDDWPSGGCSAELLGQVTVSGTGQAQASGDVATVTMAVVASNDSAVNAREQAAKVVNAVTAALSQVNGVPKDSLSTTTVSVSPNTVYNTDGTTNVTGYTFTHNLAVTLKNATATVLAAVVDQAVLAGGNALQLSNIQFDLSPSSLADNAAQARATALNSAQAALQLFAQGLHASVVAVTSFTENSLSVSGPDSTQPFYARSAAPVADSSATPTPLTSGTVTVTSAVSLTASICNSAA